MLSAKNNINNNSRRVFGFAKDFVVIVELALRDTDGCGSTHSDVHYMCVQPGGAEKGIFPLMETCYNHARLGFFFFFACALGIGRSMIR